MPSFGLKLGGNTHRLDDLPIDEFTRVAGAHGLTWLGLLDAPAANLEALYELVELIAAREKLTGDVPARPRNMREGRRLIDLIVEVEDDLPTAWDDDGIPPEGAPSTSTSSGAPEPSAGPQA